MGHDEGKKHKGAVPARRSNSVRLLGVGEKKGEEQPNKAIIAH